MYWKGSCPFHAEKTASFTVSPHKEIFYCFGCNAGGDIITFIAKAENTSPLEAAKHLAERFNLELPEEAQTQAHAKPDEKKRYWELCQLVARWCHGELKKSKDAHAYITQRGFTSEIIDRFLLGYFPGGQQSIKNLISYVQKEHFLAKDLLTANILAEGKSMLYSPFEDRIIFPITDSLGRNCGFGGRIFKPNDERAKYYNSRENAYFNKGSLLFGFEQAKKAISTEESAFLVEGYTDCLAMIQHGFPNTIATLGTACTQEHLKQLARYAETLFVIYDGDTAGQNAMLRLTDLCWHVDLDLKVIVLPSSQDPASFLKGGGNLKALIQQAQDIFSFFINHLGDNFSQKPLAKKVQITKKLLAVVGAIEEPLKRDILLQHAAKSFEIPFQVLKDELIRLKNGNSTVQTATKQVQNDLFEELPNKLKTIPILEKKLFSVIINNVKLLEKEEVAYLIDYFSQPLQDMLKRIQLILMQNPSCDLHDLFTIVTQEEKSLMSHLLIEFQEYDHDISVDQLVAQFQKQHWKNLVHDYKLKISHAQHEGNEERVKKLLADFQLIKNRLLDRGIR